MRESRETHDRRETAAAAQASAGSSSEVVAIHGSLVDAELVRQALSGSQEAFESLVRRHLQAAHRVALSVVRNPYDAEDVCQDAFVTVVERIQECRHPERFRAWLLAIVRNRAHNARARRAVRDASPLVPELTAGTDNPALGAQRSEMRGHLKTALEKLTELQREVLIRHDLEGWRHGEIAAELGISAGASRFHLFAARRALRGLLAKLYAREAQG